VRHRRSLSLTSPFVFFFPGTLFFPSLDLAQHGRRRGTFKGRAISLACLSPPSTTRCLSLPCEEKNKEQPSKNKEQPSKSRRSLAISRRRSSLSPSPPSPLTFHPCSLSLSLSLSPRQPHSTPLTERPDLREEEDRRRRRPRQARQGPAQAQR
jgi:hypothetical protein